MWPVLPDACGDGPGGWGRRSRDTEGQLRAKVRLETSACVVKCCHNCGTSRFFRLFPEPKTHDQKGGLISKLSGSISFKIAGAHLRVMNNNRAQRILPE